jgi:hypothetical protein
VTALEVEQALIEYEGLLHRRGAKVAFNLRPGATADEFTAMEQKYGFTLTQDARAVWAWHNGTNVGSYTDASHQLKAGVPFYGLDRSLEHGRFLTESDIDVFEEESEYLGRKLIMLDFDATGDAIDCAVTDEETSMVVTVMRDSPWHEFAPGVSVAGKIRWWIWAVENGLWEVAAGGGWVIHSDRYPKGPERFLI